MQLSFLPADEFDQHFVQGRREGSCIVFECTQCDYVRTFCGDKITVTGGDPGAMHEGQYYPVGIDFSTLNAN